MDDHSSARASGPRAMETCAYTVAHPVASVKAITRSLLAACLLLAAPHAIAQQYAQVSNLSGSANVNGMTATVTSAGAASTFTPCGAASGPYLLNASGASYTFTFPVPVGSVQLSVVFASGGIPGAAHVTVNGASYALTSANLTGPVPDSTCSPGLAAVISGGDLRNTGNESFDPNAQLVIPGPISSITVSSAGAEGFVFGLALTPVTYFQAFNTSGTSVVDGITTTVTPAGGATTFVPCGAVASPYFEPSSGDAYAYGFSAPVAGVNVPLVFASLPSAGAAHFTKNGSPVALTAADLLGPVLGSNCSPGLAAVASGGNLTNAGNVGFDPNAVVMLGGPISTMSVSSAAAAGFVHGMFITAGPAVALSLSNPGTQSLSVAKNSAATSLDSRLAATDANSGIDVLWSVAVAPAHGALTGFPAKLAAAGSAVPPSGLSYTPTGGYSGSDGFAIQVSDGINTTTVAMNVTVTPPPDVSSFALSNAASTQGVGVMVPVASSSLGDGTFTVNYTMSGANPGAGTATLVMSGGAGSFSTFSLANVGGSILTVVSVATVGGSVAPSSGNTTAITTLALESYSQVLDVSGASVVNGVSVAVTSGGAVSTLAPCGPSAAPYYLTGGAGSYTFTFAAPVGSVQIPAVFASSVLPGSLHVAVNGSSYALTSANLAGPVPDSTCYPGVEAGLAGGDLVNTGHEAVNSNAQLVIPGPITSITVSTTAPTGVVFGVFVTPLSYFQVTNTSAFSTVDGVFATVTSAGTAGSFSPCGAAGGPYFEPSSGDAYSFSFSPPVAGISVPLIFASVGLPGSAHLKLNGADFTLGPSNVPAPGPSLCTPGTAVVAGGNLTNAGSEAIDPSGLVILPGPISSLTVSSADASGFVHGMFITNGSAGALTFAAPGTQFLAVVENAPPTPINALLGASDQNSGMPMTWSVVVAPSHGSLGGFPTSASGAGVVTPSGLTYAPSASYTGTDGFSIQVSDGINTEVIAINVGVTAPPPVVTSVVSRRVHGAAGTFDLALSQADIHNPTIEPRIGPAQSIVFVFDKPVTAGVASITEGSATAAAPTFAGNEMTVPLTGVSNAQYVTVAVSGVAAADGGTGGASSVRVGFLLGDVNQSRVVTVADLGLVNAQLSQPVTAANYLKDVNANGTLTVADKGITNGVLTTALPAP
jgi:hypothetical protein